MIESQRSGHFARRVVHGTPKEYHCHQNRGEQESGVLPYNRMCMWSVRAQLARRKQIEGYTGGDLDDNMN